MFPQTDTHKSNRQKQPPTINSCQRPLAVIVWGQAEGEGGGKRGLVFVVSHHYHRPALPVALAHEQLAFEGQWHVVVFVLHLNDDCSRA